MKFENPIMNISMFEVENVVTDSVQTTNIAEAESKAIELAGNDGVALKLVF